MKIATSSKAKTIILKRGNQALLDARACAQIKPNFCKDLELRKKIRNTYCLFFELTLFLGHYIAYLNNVNKRLL